MPGYLGEVTPADLKLDRQRRAIGVDIVFTHFYERL